MLGRILDWWRRWREANRREIFVFWDGVRTRRVDPWAVYRATREYPDFSWDITIPMLTGEVIPGDTNDLASRSKAMGHAASCARSVFNLPSFEDGGLTELECLSLMLSFDSYCFGVKKNGNEKQSSPSSVESPQEATKECSESGSTGTPSEHGELSGSQRESRGESQIE